MTVVEVAFTKSERVEDRARALLTAGNVHVTRRLGREVAARVQGREGVYEVRCDGKGTWSCNCPARKTCAHLVAVWLVTIHSTV
jgi:uncharacterized Zn finger protein